MPGLVAAALPFLWLLLLPGAGLMLAPLLGRRGRTAVAAGFLGIGGLLVADVLVFDHSHELVLEVPNVFPRGPEGVPHRWTVATESAPVWQWHVWVALLLAVPAAWLLLRRDREPAVPHPLLHGALVFWFYLLLRLGLEKSAAHEGLVWAAGATPALLVILPFFAWYCGRRGLGAGRWIGFLFLLAWLQRIPLIAIAFFATTLQLGTHLDTHLVTELGTPLLGVRTFGDDAVRGWVHLTLIPHLTLWVVITVVAGIVLGAVPWWLARRRAPAKQPVRPAAA